MVGFVGARPMTERDLYAQQRADAMNREFYARNQYAADQRMQGRQAEAELQARQAMQAQALQAAAQQQASQQAFLGQQAQNARDDEYSQANDPMQRQARERSLDMAAQRQANLIGAQSSANINQNYEHMLDQRALALNKGMIDSALTMQKGNIDSRLLTQQGQQGLIAAGANHGYKVDDDLRQMQMQIEQRNGQMLQTHDFSEQDKKKVESIDQQMSALDDALENGSIDQNQYRQAMGKYLARKSGFSPSVPRVPFEQQLGQRSKMLPDGRIFYDSGKGIAVALPPPAGAAAKVSDPEQIKSKFDLDVADRVRKFMDLRNDEDKPLYKSETEARAAVLRSMGREVPESLQPPNPPQEQAAPQEVPLMDLQRAEEILSKYGNAPANGPGQAAAVDWARKVVWAAKQGLQQQDPRMQAVQQAPQQPMPGRQPMADLRTQNLVPGQPIPSPEEIPTSPGSVSPSDLRELRMPPGRPASTPFPPENTPAPANDQQQTQGALQAFKAIVQKFGGMPPAGSQEERIAMQAAAFLKQRGIDPTGGARRSAAPTLPGFRRPSPSSRNLAE